MDWQAWIEQKIPVTEIQRGGATVWPRGSQGLIGDSLGPIMHLHDGASEIFYFISGRCRLEIGDSEEFFDPGEFVLVPPEVPHNLWNAGDEDLLVFWQVAPNFIHNKWRTEDFPPGAMQRRAVRSKLEPGRQLPSDENIRSRLVTLAGSQPLTGSTGQAQETVLYLAAGKARVSVGKLHGVLDANDFVHVPVGTSYSAQSAEAEASLLVLETPGGG